MQRRAIQADDAPGAAPARTVPHPIAAADPLHIHRRQQAVDAAEHVFMAQGFHTSTMNDVARRAGMSKKTIYQLFVSKEQLLDAVLSRRVAVLMEPVSETEARPTADVLNDLLLRAVRFIVLPKEIAFIRLMISDNARAEPILRSLTRQGIFCGRAALGEWLARQAAAGVLRLDDPYAAAEMLVGFALGDLHVRLMLNAIPTPSAAALQRRVALAVAMFLHGVGEAAARA